MKKAMFFSLMASIFLLTGVVYAQHEGHDMTNMKDDSKQASDMDMKGDMKSGKMAMMDKDKKFIEHMIAHHQDAIDMAKMALVKSKKDEIKKLSGDIIKAQTSEIEMMKKWYKDWYNANVPEMQMGKGGMMGHGGVMMNQGGGMMGQGGMMDMCMMKGEGKGGGMMKMNMDELKNAPEFDKKFIEMMVKHHGMAVMMSGMIIDSKKGEMRKLGRDINSAQSAEIEQMIQWYIKWYGKW